MISLIDVAAPQLQMKGPVYTGGPFGMEVQIKRTQFPPPSRSVGFATPMKCSLGEASGVGIGM
jgi:hypothetical protein